ncbi:MAG: helix-turn-helix transcriptional regulator [Gammaproteobacteria bacterium]|nr:helix-turn-helix transcriptional regulator [Gammaproteobacteria bacterium]
MATQENADDIRKLNNISKRLRYVLDTLGVKQSHMANKLGLSPSGMHYLLNSDTKSSKHVKRIAEHLNVNEEWLATGKGEIHEENTTVKTYKIPVYYLDQLKLYYSTNKEDTLTTNNFILTTTPYPKKAIAIYITGTEFSPKFEVKDIVTFEQTETFKDGEILLVYLAKTNNITLKYGFHIEKIDIVLVSLDTTPCKLSLRDGDVMLGAYRECVKKVSY